MKSIELIDIMNNVLLIVSFEVTYVLEGTTSLWECVSHSFSVLQLQTYPFRRLNHLSACPGVGRGFSSGLDISWKCGSSTGPSRSKHDSPYSSKFCFFRYGVGMHIKLPLTAAANQ